MVDHVIERPWAPSGGFVGWRMLRREPRQRITSRSPGLLLVCLFGFGLAACDGEKRPARSAPPASPRGGQPKGEFGAGPLAPPQPPAGKGGAADPSAAAFSVVDTEPWVAAALLELSAQGRVDLDLPIAAHLPLLASTRSDFVTARQLIEHTAHVGSRAYEDFLRANPGSDALKAQSFLVALGADDTPGERPGWRRAHVDLMGWLVLAVAGGNSLPASLSKVLGEAISPAADASVPITPVRGALAASEESQGKVEARWKAGFPGATLVPGRPVGGAR